MIIGRDLMQELKLNIDFDSRTVTWEGSRVVMRDFLDDSRKYRELHTIMQHSTEPDSVKNQTDRVVRILDAHYEAADLKYICMEKAIHLNIREREKLYKLLSKYESLFDGTLGDWGEDEAVELELQSGVKPHHSRPYRTPYIYRALFKRELARLCRLGVLRKCQDGSEWGTPCFLIPKKNQTVRFLSDFRMLNRKIKRKIYPLPNISDILQSLEGMQYATTLDLNMGYYTIRLTPSASKLCTIVTEFGTYEYLRLPMGISCAPDIFQSKISQGYWEIWSLSKHIWMIA
jgi:hypothetical protein